MPGAHRHGDSRVCGATTIVSGQNNVRVNGELWSVVGDPNTHGGGNLILGGSSSPATVKINGKPVVVHPTTPAGPDNALHPAPPTSTAESSGDVSAYG